MTTHQPLPWTPEAEADEALETPMLRLAEHAIGLWQSAQAVGDPVLLEALRPLVIHIARALARDLLKDVENDTAH